MLKVDTRYIGVDAMFLPCFKPFFDFKEATSKGINQSATVVTHEYRKFTLCTCQCVAF